MDRGAWWATVQSVVKSQTHDWATKFTLQLKKKNKSGCGFWRYIKQDWLVLKVLQKLEITKKHKRRKKSTKENKFVIPP